MVGGTKAGPIRYARRPRVEVTGNRRERLLTANGRELTRMKGPDLYFACGKALLAKSQ